MFHLSSEDASSVYASNRDGTAQAWVMVWNFNFLFSKIEAHANQEWVHSFRIQTCSFGDSVQRGLCKPVTADWVDPYLLAYQSVVQWSTMYLKAKIDECLKFICFPVWSMFMSACILKEQKHSCLGHAFNVEEKFLTWSLLRSQANQHLRPATPNTSEGVNCKIITGGDSHPHTEQVSSTHLLMRCNCIFLWKHKNVAGLSRKNWITTKRRQA